MEEYNSLTDPHLTGYFASCHRRQQLKRAGLLTEKGEIVSEATYRLNLVRQSCKAVAVKENVAHLKQANEDRRRFLESKKRLEQMAKAELVQHVKSRSSLRRTSSHDLSESETAMDHNASLQRTHGFEDMDMTWKQEKSIKPTVELEERSLWDYALLQRSLETWNGESPYHLPMLAINDIPAHPPKLMTSRSPRLLRKRMADTDPVRNPRVRSTYKQIPGSLSACSRRDSSSSSPLRRQEAFRPRCQVTMSYVGGFLDVNRESVGQRGDDVAVEQQHCGGNTLIVYRGKLKPGEEFGFTSRRHKDFPFSLTIYINGKRDCRLSTCCEFRHRQFGRLAGKSGHFRLIRIEGPRQCSRCQQEEESTLKTKASLSNALHSRNFSRETSTVLRKTMENRKSNFLTLPSLRHTLPSPLRSNGKFPDAGDRDNSTQRKCRSREVVRDRSRSQEHRNQNYLKERNITKDEKKKSQEKNGTKEKEKTKKKKVPTATLR